MKLLQSGIILMFSVLFVTTGCKKNDSSASDTYKCTNCKTTPDAIAANDNSSKGVYKGIVIGSTGTISFNLMNGGTTITATLVLDGVTAQLTSTGTWNAGQPYTGAFKGTLSGQDVTVNFTVQANGGVPVVTSATIPGHPNAVFSLIKESSTSLIECFEGTYETTKPEKGTFNLVCSRSLRLFVGTHRPNGSSSSEAMSGTITTDGKIMQDATSYLGTLSGDVISGSFKDGDGKTVTVKGKRTL